MDSAVKLNGDGAAALAKAIANALWCTVKFEADEKGKTKKIPYGPVTGRKLSAASADGWADYSAAVITAREGRKYDGIGVKLGDNMLGIDIDHCVDAHGKLSPLAQEIIDTVRSYTELSPSGTGIHIFACGTVPADYKERFQLKNTDLGLELYPGNVTARYLTVTGNRLNDYPVRDATRAIMDIADKYMCRSAPPPLLPHANHCCEAELSDRDLIDKACSSDPAFNALYHGDTSAYAEDDSRADLALCGKLAFWTECNPDKMDTIFRQSMLYRKKWEREDYRTRTINMAIANCRSTYTASVPVQEAVRTMGNLTYDPSVAASSAETNKEETRDAWEPLQPIGSKGSTVHTDIPYPVKAFTGILHDYIIAKVNQSQVIPAMIASVVLTVLAVCLQHKAVVVTSNGHSEPLCIYGALIGGPGSRKSDTIQSPYQPVYDYQVGYNLGHAAERQHAKAKRAALKKRIRKLADEAIDDPAADAKLLECQKQLSLLPSGLEVTLTASDCTPEASAQNISDNGGTFGIVSTDGGLFNLLSGCYSARPNTEVYTQAYDGDHIVIGRKGNRDDDGHMHNVSINHPTLSICVGVQPDIFWDAFSIRRLRSCGFYERFIYVWCDRYSSADTAVAIPEIVQANYNKLITDLLQIPTYDNPVQLTLSPAAEAIADEYGSRMQGKAEQEVYMAGWLYKACGRALRLAGLLHIADHVSLSDTTITAAEMQRAIDLSEWYRRTAKATYLYGAGLSEEDKRLQRAVDKLHTYAKRQNKLSMSKTEIHECLKSIYRDHNSDKAMDKDLAQLENQHYIIHKVDTSTGGRPRETYYLRPDAFGA